MANLSQLSHARQNNNKKVRHNHTRAVYRTVNQQGVLCSFSQLICSLTFIMHSKNYSS